MLRWLSLPLAACAAVPAAACDFEPVQIFFAIGSARLSDADRQGLDYIESLTSTGAFIRITGHTDTIGRAEANMRLSQRRVAAVREYLIGRSVPPERILSQSFGESRSITALADGQADRRHRFVLVDVMSPSEARKGRAGRGKTSCGD